VSSAPSSAQRWADELAAWAIPEEIMAQAPESPWAFHPAGFRRSPGPSPDTVSRQRAREVLPEGGSVLDVGCGGGAAGLALAPPAALVIGFDPNADLLALFAEHAEEQGVAHEEVQGDWPEHAARAGPADVVVTHHVVYNIPQIGEFAAALTAHARRRVVIEMSQHHPRAGVNDLWRHFWDLERPSGPTADDAAGALVEAGIHPNVERWQRGPFTTDREKRVASIRRYLCLPPERDPEIDALLGEDAFARPAEVVTLWWDA
jgi:SAM-dependent methyltransferase